MKPQITVQLIILITKETTIYGPVNHGKHKKPQFSVQLIIFITQETKIFCPVNHTHNTRNHNFLSS